MPFHNVRENWIRDEMKAYLPREFVRFKMTSNRIADVILQFPEIFALRRDAAALGRSRIVPRSD